jgi:hypothetical protein
MVLGLQGVLQSGRSFQHLTINLGGVSKRAQLCGSYGYDSTIQAYCYKESQSLFSVNGCSAHCLADSKCLSFAVGDGACMQYTVAV